jgi:hypothetical protein
MRATPTRPAGPRDPETRVRPRVPESQSPRVPETPSHLATSPQLPPDQTWQPVAPLLAQRLQEAELSRLPQATPRRVRYLDSTLARVPPRPA